MQRQHLPLQRGSRFREARRNFWHDLPRIIDQGSKTPSRVPFLLVLDTTSCRRGRRSPQPDMIRKGRHYNAGCGGGSPEQRNVHAPRNGARERESGSSSIAGGRLHYLSPSGEQECQRKEVLLPN